MECALTLTSRLNTQPFTKTIDYDEGLILSIWAIFFAEIVTTNAIQLLDPMGHLQRHFLAPRAATQDLMNLNMQGQVVELAERYTVSAWCDRSFVARRPWPIGGELILCSLIHL